MNAVNLLLLSFALAADAFAVSVTNGLSMHPPNAGQRLVSAACFGVFQAGMPLLGYAAGHGFADFMAYYAHYIALALLCMLGTKMMVSAALQARHQRAPVLRHFSIVGLLAQAIATSIDALSVGIGFAILSADIFQASLCIGIITFTCCLFGFDLGKRFGTILADRAMLLGGLLLIFIGVYIFITHHVPGL